MKGSSFKKQKRFQETDQTRDQTIERKVPLIHEQNEHVIKQVVLHVRMLNDDSSRFQETKQTCEQELKTRMQNMA